MDQLSLDIPVPKTFNVIARAQGQKMTFEVEALNHDQARSAVLEGIPGCSVALVKVK